METMHKLFLILTVFGLAATARAETKTAIFAGGCFWCMQEPFDQVKGVTNTVVGYTGGSKEDANTTSRAGVKAKLFPQSQLAAALGLSDLVPASQPPGCPY